MGIKDNGDGTTSARISSFGFMVGTSTAAFTATSPPPLLAFTGAIDFTTALGVLHAPVTGVFDIPAGRFTADSSNVSGSGLLRGVTGELHIRGTQDSMGAFKETITGRLCVRV